MHPEQISDPAMAAAAPADRDLIAVLWQTLRARRLLIALVTLASLILAVFYLRSAEYDYLAQMRVAAAPGSASRTPRLGSLSGLAALANVGVEAEATPFRLYLEDLHSPTTAAGLAADAKLMQKIFADEWDGKNWTPRPSMTDRIQATLLRLSGASVPAWQPPDAARLRLWLMANIAVIEEQRSPVVTLALAHPDPVFAKALLERLHRVADSRARARALARATANIRHLNRRLVQVDALDHRQAMIVTRASEEQRLMLARNPTPFATQRFGAASASAAPVSPRQGRVLIVALVLGVIGGAMLALLLGPVARNRA